MFFLCFIYVLSMFSYVLLMFYLCFLDVFSMVFKTENLQKLGTSDYDVAISKAGIAHFKSTSKNIQYWIATETNSSYN